MADPIFDAGNRNALRTRSFVNEDGILMSERRPNGRVIMMIDSAGNEIPFRPTNAMSNTSERDAYGLEVLASKTAPNAKWKTEPMIPSATCPQQTEYEFRLPQHLKTGKRCTVAEDGQPIGESRIDGAMHHCKCIAQLARERRARQSTIEASRDPRTTIQEAILHSAQGTNAKLVDLLNKLTEAPAPAPKASK